MNITLNNRPENIDATELTMNQLLKYKNFTFRMLVIKINGKLVKKDAYDSTVVRDGDIVSVLHLVSGG